MTYGGQGEAGGVGMNVEGMRLHTSTAERLRGTARGGGWVHGRMLEWQGALARVLQRESVPRGCVGSRAGSRLSASGQPRV